MNATKIAVIVIASLHFLGTATAQTSLSPVLGDGAVLQRDKPVNIWGRSKPGLSVRVEFGGQRRDTAAGVNGQWLVTLDPMAASDEGRELLVVDADGGRAAAQDVLVGEVWICGGQSNMEWKLGASVEADLEIPSAHYPAIRFLRLQKIARDTPSTQVAPAKWRAATPEHAGECTGVGYFFAMRLHRRLGVPIGLVDTSWGGTMAQHWVSRDTLEEIPEMKSYLDAHEAKLTAWRDGGGEEGAKRRYKADVEKWETERAAARAAGKREPRRPNERNYEDPAQKGQPAGMYNGTLAPLAPLIMRGVLFYQGENNSFGESWKPFPKTYPAVISDWRRTFGDDELPFGLIQIAGWSSRRTMTYDMNHHTNVVREVQHRTWEATPGTGLIVTFDANSNQSIHPGCKRPIGERAARWALAEVYGAMGARGKPLEWKGPLFVSAATVGKKIVVQFDESTSRGLRLDKDAELGFYIAGADRVFHVARARIAKGSAVEVWCDDVPEPVAVRYGWSNLPLGSLMNQRELPAYPFRTDTWPLVPHQSQGEYKVGR